ncbi:hypothetical protein GLOIN_2v1789168 [Rhizophagus irregularis DAOM 181602=DAOM 197198]|uniref:Uncharacterized protein n=1 Tax=Rhizophagus irregularis (strain DAOM 181602 / DAOM 197198 / MUCL 43194) TaxID=747089 RepID=A0A2P4P1Z3_RHIID|nr:hypothetical protein GLOIN_2v1789168 [Rhizophagus irregularis DAOM 181602=DAOM 197198]POG59410.1 hypothetical protein GLOIN_2v1789168 [Rhizophagus irregularis DAOM 181602=DAOM 197198]GET64148.1 hypothetical protein GLOIN_2v1789168 [Rhizophagus irregularis DAOM 181602=DAOM 197198]|eukprot:XP_025166276.1 hypothetical protein GLOIN_2v1789168 [Rhizophagus irregularis DAOM 181602=DAOM 197198]
MVTKNRMTQIVDLQQNLLKILLGFKSIHIAYCSSLNNLTKQIINLNKQFKLKSLFLSWNEESLDLLLQNLVII